MTDVSPKTARTLVLGIGNILWADEGFGVRAVEEFHRRYEAGDDVTVLDGGTQGLYLVQYVREVDNLIVFDAVDYGLAPGTLKLVRDDEVPKFTGAKKMSLHQTGFQEVLSASDLMGSYPENLLLIGAQPLLLDDWGGPLTAPIHAVIDPAIVAAVDQLRAWGVDVRERTAPLAENEQLLGHDIDLAGFERAGDPRAVAAG